MVREAFTKAVDAGVVTPELTAALEQAIAQEDSVVNAVNDCHPKVNKSIDACLTSNSIDAGGHTACQELSTVTVAQQIAIAELIQIQRVSFSEEIPNFKLQKQATQGSLLAFLIFGGWWLIVAFRRERIWVDDSLCNNCTLCYTNAPGVFQRTALNKVRLNEQSWQVAVDDDDYYDQAREQVRLCEQDALSLTRFVPRRIKRQDDQK